MGRLRWEEDFLDNTWHYRWVLLITAQMHREDILLHVFGCLVEQLHGVGWLGHVWPAPLCGLPGLFVFLAGCCLGSSLLLLLTVVVARVKLTEGYLDVSVVLGVQLVGRWIELLHLWFARYKRQTILKHIKHLVEVDVEICFLGSFHLQELLELLLLLVDLEPVHIVLFFIIREDVVFTSVLDFRSEARCLKLCFLEVPVEWLVVSAFVGNLVEVQFQSEELLDLF